MAGLIPKFASLRSQAKEIISDAAFHFFDGGAEDEITLEENRESWKRHKLVPRVLLDVTFVDTTWNFLGQEFKAPIIVAPMSMQCWIHKEGELATAQAAANCGLPYGLSMFSSKGLNEIDKLSQKPVVLSQIYMLNNEEFMASLFKEFYQLGARCFILTVDAPLLGNRERHTTNMFDEPNSLFALANHERIEILSTNKNLTEVFKHISKSLDWKVIRRIKDIVDVKVILKGILSSKDAKLAVDHGADGIIVSNHGGRQVDTSVTALDVLPGIAKAVNGKIPVLVDGGIQRGTDIIKAIALGASGVLIGRPLAFALAVGGEKMVTQILEDLKRELTRNMALCGCRSLSEITPELIFKP
eukprot:g2125.t1